MSLQLRILEVEEEGRYRKHILLEFSKIGILRVLRGWSASLEWYTRVSHPSQCVSKHNSWDKAL